MKVASLRYYAVAVIAAAICACAPMHRNLTSQTSRPIRILVLGDSVAWGQGLREVDKFPNFLAKGFEAQGYRASNIISLAHSGAKIGQRGESGPASRNGEIPDYYPTIPAQVDKAVAGRPYDVIVVMGCINDVGVNEVVDPFPNPRLSTDIRADCGTRLHRLLLKIRQKLVDANRPTRVVVVSYFPILSDDSSRMPGAGAWLYDLFQTMTGHSTISLQTQERVLQRPCRASKSSLVCTAIAHAQQFKSESDDAIANVAMKGLDPSVFLFAKSDIPSDRAAYANQDSSHSWIWEAGVSTDQSLKPLDDAQSIRLPLCRTDPVGKHNPACFIASMGHPNRCGEIAYANAILSVLNLKWRPTMPARCSDN